MRRLAAFALLASLVLAGCSSSPLPGPPDSAQPETVASESQPSEPGPSDSEPSPDETPSEGAAADPELDALRGALQGQSPADPEALVAAVVAAGFERSAIERTRELDSLGAPVTFLEIAVKVDDGCLIGQVGDGDPMAIRAEALGGGRCLVGDVLGVD